MKLDQEYYREQLIKQYERLLENGNFSAAHALGNLYCDLTTARFIAGSAFYHADAFVQSNDLQLIFTVYDRLIEERKRCPDERPKTTLKLVP